MTVVVAYKYAGNPQEASVGADGTLDWSRAKAAVSEYDPVAIQLARQVADASGTELVGASVGLPTIATSMAKKAALSRGFDRAVVVADEEVADWSSTKVASAIAALVKQTEGADLVVTGDSSIDDGARMMSALVAGYLGWPCFQEVVAVTKEDAGYKVDQLVPGGVRSIKVDGPVVVAATSDAVETKAPSMKDILAAGKKPMEQIQVADLELAPVELEVTERAKPAAKARKKEIFTGDDAAAQLVAALRADGVI